MYMNIYMIIPILKEIANAEDHIEAPPRSVPTKDLLNVLVLYLYVILISFIQEGGGRVI